MEVGVDEEGLAPGISGVGYLDEKPDSARTQSFEGAFKPFSVYNEFLDDLIDGGDEEPVTEHI